MKSEEQTRIQALCSYWILTRSSELPVTNLDRERLAHLQSAWEGTPYAGCASLLLAVRLFRQGSRREAARLAASAAQSLWGLGTGGLRLDERDVRLCRDLVIIGECGLTDGGDGGVHLVAEDFGDFSIHVAETGEELHWRTRKAQECMAWLLHVRGRRVSREELLSALWGTDDFPANEVAALHNILSSIRRTLKPYGLENLIQYKEKLYYLEEGAIYDERVQVDELCRAIESGDAAAVRGQSRRLLELAGRPYMKNVEGRWCDDDRYRYENTFLKGLERPATITRRAGWGRKRHAAI